MERRSHLEGTASLDGQLEQKLDLIPPRDVLTLLHLQDSIHLDLDMAQLELSCCNVNPEVSDFGRAGCKM